MLISEGFKEEGLRLFDLLSDPFEKDNQIVKDSEIKNALRAELQKKIELSQKLRSEILGIDKKSRIITFSSDKNKIITEEEKQRLEALGYVE
jgi:ribosomal protein S1